MKKAGRVFGWCALGDHEHCTKNYRRFAIDAKTNKVVYFNETIRCECQECECGEQ